MSENFTAPGIVSYPGCSQTIIGTMREMHQVRMIDLCSLLRYDTVAPNGEMHTYSPPPYDPSDGCRFEEWRRRYRRAAERHFNALQDNAKKGVEESTSDFAKLEKEMRNQIYDEQLKVIEYLATWQPKKKPWWKLW